MSYIASLTVQDLFKSQKLSAQNKGTHILEPTEFHAMYKPNWHIFQ